MTKINKRMTRIVLFFLLTGIFDVQASPEKLNVLSSIKPVQLIVSAIGGDKIIARQLIPDYVSVHDYSFKLSDIKTIKNADVVFRIDEHLESIVSPLLEQYLPAKSVVSLAEQEGITLLRLQSNEDSHQHSHQHESHEEGNDDEENTDLHIWTSPKNGIVMAKVIASKLSSFDPENAAVYQSNLIAFKEKLLKTEKEIEKRLSKLKRKPYIVFHDSWHYFASSFDLHEPVVVSFHESLGGNIKSILNVRNKIKEEGIGCIVSDLSIRQDRINTITEGMQIKTVQIDALANGVS